MHDDHSITGSTKIERLTAIPLEKLPDVIALAVSAAAYVLHVTPELIDVTPAEFRRALRDPLNVRVRYLRGRAVSPVTVADIDDLLLAVEIADDAPIFATLLPATLIEYLRLGQSEKRFFYPPPMPKPQ